MSEYREGGAPKVSVAMITYNHGPYIEQAIESVLDQDTTFPFELVIGEDASVDGTRKIVLDYANRFPDRVRAIVGRSNVGMNRNLVRTIQACRGRYIALVEGDDYWTSGSKLEQQAAYLDRHSNCAICYHNVLQFNDWEDAPPAPRFPPGPRRVASLADLLERDFIPTCSTMFRAGLIDGFPDWFFSLPMGDWPLHVLNALHGDIGYVDEIMGAYRLHAGGAWTRLETPEQDRQCIDFYETILVHLGLEDRGAHDTALSTLHYRLGVHYSHLGEWTRSRDHAVRALRYDPTNRRFSLGLMFLMLRKPITAPIRGLFSGRRSAS